MDWSAVAGAIISGAVSLVVCIITQMASNKATKDLLEYRLTQLEKKVDKHNNLVERTYKLEESVAIINERMEGDYK